MSPRRASTAPALLAALVTVFAVLGTATPAHADKDDDRPGYSATGTGDGALFQGNQQQHQQTPAVEGQPAGDTSYAGTGEVEMMVYPDGTTAPVNDPPDLSWMPGAVDSCGSNWGGDGWNAQYAEATPCAPADPEEPAQAPVITAAMVSAAARVLAPVNPPHVEPGTVSYVNIPNNYWAAPPAVDNSITLLGVTIPLQWRPTSTTWSFGDGSTATGNGVQGADLAAPGTVEHAYRRQGSYDISTTTNYNLTFVLPGGGAQTIAVTSPPSAPVTLPIREIQTLTSYVN